MTSERNCSKCGTSNPAYARFCNDCGAELKSTAESSANNRESLVGQLVFDRYNIIKQIGAGGMGAVYLAEQKSIKRPVALKVLSSNTTGHPTLRDRFRNEASLASRLNHPNTVTIYDFDITPDGTLFIAMERVDGRNLGEELPGNRQMDWRRVCHIGVQIASSLQNAHDNHIIHRDLKPENIMLTTAGRDEDHVKVLDFGLAKILVENDDAVVSGLTSPNEVFGTPDFMSPEQAKKATLDHRTDIYSLGVILYRMLTGRLPFESDNYIEMLAMHIKEPPRPFCDTFPENDIPAELEQLVLSMLEKEPNHRPAEMLDIIHQFERIVSNGSFAATPPKEADSKKPVQKQPVPEKQIPKKQARARLAPKPAPQKKTPTRVEKAPPKEEPVKATRKERAAGTKVKQAAKTPSQTKKELPVEPAKAREDSIQRGPTENEPLDAETTLQRLMERVKKKRDFPVISKNVSELNAKAASSTTSASQLANLILKDSALTVKLVRLVNSPFYGHLQGRITMISRAVVLLGFDAVRDAALGVLLFDHLMSKDPEQAAKLKTTAINSLSTAILSKGVAVPFKHLNTEEAYIGGLFRDLGRQAALFYFPEEMEEIRRLAAIKKISEDDATYRVLGVSLEQLGKELAKLWNFPESVTSTMTRLPGGKIGKPVGKTDQLRHITTFAGDLSQIISISDKKEQKRRLDKLRAKFARSIKLDDKVLDKIIDNAREQILDYAKAMNWGISDSPLLAGLMNASKRSEDDKRIDSDIPGAETDLEDEENTKPNTIIIKKERILISGTDEVAKSIRGRFDINTVILMILETMFRGLSLHRVIFCLNDVHTGTIRAKSGFGDRVEEFIESFQFPLRGPSDVFRKAMMQGTDAIVTDSASKKWAYHTPKWYKDSINAPMFLLYPVRIRAFPAALFYGDLTEANVAIDDLLTSQMNQLRDTAKQAIEKSYNFGQR